MTPLFFSECRADPWLNCGGEAPEVLHFTIPKNELKSHVFPFELQSKNKMLYNPLLDNLSFTPQTHRCAAIFEVTCSKQLTKDSSDQTFVTHNNKTISSKSLKLFRHKSEELQLEIGRWNF